MSIADLSKQQLREQFLRKRKAIPLSRREEAERGALALLKKLSSCQQILSYVAKAEELSLRLVNETLNLEGRLLLPTLEGNILVPREVLDLSSDLELGPFQLFQPKDSCKKGVPDCVLVPAIAYDTWGNRLGWGKGHYDRFLTAFSQKSLGVIFFEQLSEQPLPTEPHDQTVEEICTF